MIIKIDEPTRIRARAVMRMQTGKTVAEIELPLAISRKLALTDEDKRRISYAENQQQAVWNPRLCSPRELTFSREELTAFSELLRNFSGFSVADREDWVDDLIDSIDSALSVDQQGEQAGAIPGGIGTVLHANRKRRVVS